MEFCNSEFWDSDITWNSGILEFTDCFQQTVFAWTPCLFLWIFSFFDFHQIRHSKYSDIPWNNFNITKILLSFLLVALSLLDLVLILVFKDVNLAELINPVLKIITFVITVH
jgi:ATP-binding cassette subfamily C (CFTR/MRP) protein 1